MFFLNVFFLVGIFLSVATERVRTRKSSNSKTQTLFCHLEAMGFFFAVIAAEVNDDCVLREIPPQPVGYKVRKERG